MLSVLTIVKNGDLVVQNLLTCGLVSLSPLLESPVERMLGSVC